MAPARPVARAGREPSGLPDQTGARRGLVDRLAARRLDRPSFVWAAVFGRRVGRPLRRWRLPPVLDALARHPALILAELATLAPAGVGLWLELVNSRPLTPRLSRPQRAAIAALAMWSTWAMAYILGFADRPVVHAYDGWAVRCRQSPTRNSRRSCSGWRPPAVSFRSSSSR